VVFLEVRGKKEIMREEFEVKRDIYHLNEQKWAIMPF
jgi:hypothetical protein